MLKLEAAAWFSEQADKLSEAWERGNDRELHAATKLISIILKEHVHIVRNV